MFASDLWLRDVTKIVDKMINAQLGYYMQKMKNRIRHFCLVINWFLTNVPAVIDVATSIAVIDDGICTCPQKKKFLIILFLQTTSIL
jgi:hypothetical protein